ncbi:hypothetical protein ABC977_10360 [Thioalkalicoccus limnaeus]|uniref:Glycine-zipper-containing OmpA-like membrane domain-containing protein n=1 Tax=Thioalkalicoccus limnaeus TaxID=120681 RepID=A0ABV4BE69_9GAMM
MMIRPCPLARPAGSGPTCRVPVRRAAPLLVVLALFGCATSEPRPVLYPNAHYQSVGDAAARRDIHDCRRQARAFGTAGGQGGEIARGTASGALIGGAAAGAWGAVRGDAAERAVAGAAAGGAGGLARGVVRASEPPPLYRNFVQRCLRERGYDVIGWR